LQQALHSRGILFQENETQAHNLMVKFFIFTPFEGYDKVN